MPKRAIDPTKAASPRLARLLEDGPARSPARGSLHSSLAQPAAFAPLARNLGGGHSRLDEILVDHDVDTVVLAFSHPDRAEFFGPLDSYYGHGVAAKVHCDHADAVLTQVVAAGDLVDIDLEPWDPKTT